MGLSREDRDVIDAGVSALRAVGTQLRVEAGRRPEAPELWLAVRDVEGLAGRIEPFPESDWETGDHLGWVTGQDLGVVEELLAVGVPVRAGAPFKVSAEDVEPLTRLSRWLRQRLQRYLEPRDRTSS